MQLEQFFNDLDRSARRELANNLSGFGMAVIGGAAEKQNMCWHVVSVIEKRRRVEADIADGVLRAAVRAT